MEESFAPFADDFSTRVEPGRDVVVLQSLRGQEDHPGSHDYEIR